MLEKTFEPLLYSVSLNIFIEAISFRHRRHSRG